MRAPACRRSSSACSAKRPDLIFPRDQQELRLAQLAELGFTDWETWGEAAPVYLFGQNGDLKLDLGITDEADGRIWMRVPQAGLHGRGWRGASRLQLRLPDAMFEHPLVELEGIPIRPISPLAIYEIPRGSGASELLRAAVRMPLGDPRSA